jgi:hypothetical protein
MREEDGCDGAGGAPQYLRRRGTGPRKWTVLLEDCLSQCRYGDTARKRKGIGDSERR